MLPLRALAGTFLLLVMGSVLHVLQVHTAHQRMPLLLVNFVLQEHSGSRQLFHQSLDARCAALGTFHPQLGRRLRLHALLVLAAPIIHHLAYRRCQPALFA